jgi:hypothetical protein
MMKIIDLRSNMRCDRKDTETKLIFGSDGEYVYRREYQDVLWILDDSAKKEIGVYMKDIPLLIKALRIAKIGYDVEKEGFDANQ